MKKKTHIVLNGSEPKTSIAAFLLSILPRTAWNLTQKKISIAYME